jgi:general secretion pathway protein E
MSSVTRLPYRFAQSKGIIAGDDAADGMTLLVREGVAAQASAEVVRTGGFPAHVEVIAAEAFNQRLAASYARDGDSADLAENLGNDLDLSRMVQEIPETEDLLDAENEAPIIRMINAVLGQALKEDASDIHIEPYESRSIVRFRVDGSMRNVIEPHRSLHAAMLTRIKVMAQLDIAEKRLPQDGRISLRLAGRAIDVRVSTLPTGYGERAVLRILEKDRARLNLSASGMDERTLKQVDNLVHQAHGIVLVTGPTGSGKTTTLYSALAQLDTTKQNIMTVEDPIEYNLEHIAQTQVNARIDMSFAKALRSILRQDPDVIMIGEIRDLETAQIAVQASLTGHLVLATLHTNDTVSAVTRLVDMGVEPFLLSSSVIGVLAQRLVRRLCAHCREPYRPDTVERELLGVEATQIYRATGCVECNQTGYSGRTGIYELLKIDEHMRHLIHERAAEQDLKSRAVASGMIDLRRDGLRWVLSGVTSLEELLSVTRDDQS